MKGFDLRFQIPSNMMLVGPTSSGKTTWLKNLVKYKDSLFATAPKSMLLFYKEHQKVYDEMEKLMNKGKNGGNLPVFKKYKNPPKSIEDLKEIFSTFSKKTPKIVVFDDYLDEIGPPLKHLFTVLTHHYNCFTILLSQTLFEKKKTTYEL